MLAVLQVVDIPVLRHVHGTHASHLRSYIILTVAWGVLAPLDLFHKVGPHVEEKSPLVELSHQAFNSLFFGVLFWGMFTAAPFIISLYIGPHLTPESQGNRCALFSSAALLLCDACRHSVDASIAVFAGTLVFVLILALAAYRKEGVFCRGSLLSISTRFRQVRDSAQICVRALQLAQRQHSVRGVAGVSAACGTGVYC